MELVEDREILSGDVKRNILSDIRDLLENNVGTNKREQACKNYKIAELCIRLGSYNMARKHLDICILQFNRNSDLIKAYRLLNIVYKHMLGQQ